MNLRQNHWLKVECLAQLALILAATPAFEKKQTAIKSLKKLGHLGQLHT